MLVQARSRDKVVKTAQGSFNLTFIEMMKGLSTQAVRPLPTELRRYWAVMLCKWENSVSVFYPPHAFYSIFSTLNARHTFVWPLTLDSSLRQCWQRKDLGFIPAFCHSLPPFFRFFSPPFASQNKLVSLTAFVSRWLRMAHLSVSKGIIIPLGSFAFSELWQVRGNFEIIYNDGSGSEWSIIHSCPGEFTLIHSSFMDNGRTLTTFLEK